MLQLSGSTGTVGPGRSALAPAMTRGLLGAVDLGLLLVPPEGLPPAVFDHRYSHVRLTAGRAY